LLLLLFDRLFLAFPCHDQSKGKKDEERKYIEHGDTIRKADFTARNIFSCIAK
jgi:hypothetical protein